MATNARARVVALVAIIALAVNAVEEVVVLDDGEDLASDIAEVTPFMDAEELIEIKGMVSKANKALQDKLAADAKEAQQAKLLVEKASHSAELSYNAADEDTKPAKKAKHVKLLAAKKSATERAELAIQKAKDAGVDIAKVLEKKFPKLGEHAEAAPAAKKAAPKAAAVPAIAKPVAPTNLQSILKKRKVSRRKREAAKANKDYELAKMQKEADDYHLTKAMTKVKALRTKVAEAQSAQAAAKRDTRAHEKRLGEERTAEFEAKDAVKKVKKSYGVAKATLREAKVEHIVASSLAKSGGARRNLKKAEKRRALADARLKEAKAGIVAKKLAAEKSKAAMTAAKAAFEKAKLKVESTHGALHKDDERFSSAKYDESDYRQQLADALEDEAQRKAEAKNAAKHLKDAQEEASSAIMMANNDGSPKAQLAEDKYLLRVPKAARKEARASAKDHDGLSSKGKVLVSADGEVEADYLRRWDALKMPNVPTNPILDAQARAQIGAKAKAVIAKARPHAQMPGPTTKAARAAITNHLMSSTVPKEEN